MKSEKIDSFLLPFCNNLSSVTLVNTANANLLLKAI